MAELMNKVRTLFMGTPDFSVPCLEKLLTMEQLAVVGAVTQPDKPRGRGKKLTPSPVKVSAKKNNLPVYQPVRIKNDEDFLRQLREEIRPELIIVVAFGQILPAEVLNLPEYGCVNVHASLLPKYRGAAPMQRVIMDGENITGVTTMLMDIGLDTGDMLEKSQLTIGPDMTLEELHDALSLQGAELMKTTIEKILDGTVVRTKQDDSLSCYAKMIEKDTGAIDWSRTTAEIHNLVRALDSAPGAFTSLGEEKYKIWRTKPADLPADGKAPGDILRADGKGLLVKTGDGVIEVLELQAPAKKRMKAADYLRGHALELPAKFE